MGIPLPDWCTFIKDSIGSEFICEILRVVADADKGIVSVWV